MNVPFDPGALIDAAQTGLIPSCTISLPKDDFITLVSWMTVSRYREGRPTTKGTDDYDMEPGLGLLSLYGPNGVVVVKADEPLVDLEAVGRCRPEVVETAKKFVRWYFGKIQDQIAEILRNQALLATTQIWKKPGIGVKPGGLEPARLIECDSGPMPLNLPPVSEEVFHAQQDSPIARAIAEYDRGIEEPAASIAKRKLDERPVEAPCDCGGAAAGTPHAPWCATRSRKG